MNDFFKDIKPYLDLLSQYKRTLSLPSNISQETIIELKRIYKEHKIGNACTSCKLDPILRGLIGYYERTKRRGKKKEL